MGSVLNAGHEGKEPLGFFVRLRLLFRAGSLQLRFIQAARVIGHRLISLSRGRSRFGSPNLTTTEREAIRSLSKDLPALWQAATTTSAERQRIVRLLLERVVVNMQGSSDHVDVMLCWAGGFTNLHELIRPVLRYNQTADYDRMVAGIVELRDQGWSFAQIAAQLNHEGFRPAKQAEKFHSDIVSRLVWKLEKRCPGERATASQKGLRTNEWLVIDLAAELNMSKHTLFSWIKRGWAHVVRQMPGYRGRIICWVDTEELARLRRLRQTKHGWWDPPLPSKLTKPKMPPKT